jgi:hypothetical protein
MKTYVEYAHPKLVAYKKLVIVKKLANVNRS